MAGSAAHVRGGRALWASRRIGQPVKWTQTRNEAHISDDDARDNIVDAALALERDGKFFAVKIRSSAI
jgi:carbon-monoxide dehydrogenase large subunit